MQPWCGALLDYWRCCMFGRTTCKVSEEARERFLEAERSMLEQRRNGSLAQAIGEPLSGESPEELPSPRARSLRSPGNGRKTPSPLTLAAWTLARKVRVWPSSNSARTLLVYLSFATKEHIRP